MITISQWGLSLPSGRNVDILCCIVNIASSSHKYLPVSCPHITSVRWREIFCHCYILAILHPRILIFLHTYILTSLKPRIIMVTQSHTHILTWSRPHSLPSSKSYILTSSQSYILTFSNAQILTVLHSDILKWLTGRQTVTLTPGVTGFALLMWKQDIL